MPGGVEIVAVEVELRAEMGTDTVGLESWRGGVVCVCVSEDEGACRSPPPLSLCGREMGADWSCAVRDAPAGVQCWWVLMLIVGMRARPGSMPDAADAQC